MAFIFQLMFYLLPIFDALNGFMVRNYNFYGIGSMYHLLLVIVLVLLPCINGKLKAGKYEKFTISLVIIFVLSYFIGFISGETATSISLERVEKIICTSLSIAGICRMIKSGRIKQDVFERILEYQCTIVPIMTLFSDLSGIYNRSYIHSNSGRIGFYTNLNEATIIFMIIMTLLIRKMLYELQLKHVILFIMTEACVIFTESKSGVVAGVLFALIFAIYLLCTRVSRKVRARTLMIGLVSIPVGVYVVSKVYKTILHSFLTRQSYVYNSFSDSGIMAYLTSGRADRIQTLLIGPFSETINKGGYNILIALGKAMFGFGLTSDYYSTFEMDILDFILYGGIMAGIIWIMYSYNIFKSVLRNQREKIYAVCIMIIIAASVFIGHVWTGGVCGVYFALIIAGLTCLQPYDEYMKHKE